VTITRPLIRIFTISTLNIMLSNITTPTQAIQPTQTMGAVNPIGQAKVPQLTDGLDKLPEIKVKGETKPEKLAPTYQWYSLAKYFPASSQTTTPATPGTTAPAESSAYTNLYSKSYSDYMAALQSANKPAAPKTHLVNGNVYLTDEEYDYFNNIGAGKMSLLNKGQAYIENLYKTHQEMLNRQENKAWQPILQPNQTNYKLIRDPSLDAGWSDYELSRLQGNPYFWKGNPWDLTNEDINTLMGVAQSNNLGQAGMNELVNKTYYKKYLDYAEPKLVSAINVMNDPYGQSWKPLEGQFFFSNKLSIDGVRQAQAQSTPSKNFWTQLWAGMNTEKGSLATSAVTALLTKANPIGMALMFGKNILGAFESGKDKSDIKSRQSVSMFYPDGTMKHLYSQFTPDEQYVFRYWAEKNGNNDYQSIVDAFVGTIYNQVYGAVDAAGSAFMEKSKSLQDQGMINFDNGVLKLSNV
jgi:hypothetical protein